MKKSRPLIGIIAAEAEYVFFSNALNTIQKELFAANMDAAVFSSLMMSGNAEFDAAENSVYDLVDFDLLDGIIIFSSSINDATSRERLIARIKSDFKGPVVSFDSQVDGFANCLYNYEPVADMMVSHFHEQVIAKGKIGGQARAMIITSRIERCIEYYHAVNKCLANRHSPYKAIIAFSGEKQLDKDAAAVTSAGLNGFPDAAIPKTFKKDPYRFLIVADMFQTGYDEPLLHTMYVDKQLYDIKAVQTLSRLNRACPKKYDTFVLDFFNDPNDIIESFSRYYKTTLLSGETDPNKLYDLIADMESYQVFSDEHVEQLVNRYLDGADRDQLDPALDACASVYKQLDTDGQIKYNSPPKGIVRTYGVLSAILPYGKPEWEKLSIFLNMLIPKLPSPQEDDLSQGILEAIDLDSYRIEKKETISLILPDEDAEVGPVPMSTAKGKQEPEMDVLSAILSDFNDMFGNIDWNDADNVRRQILEIPAMVSRDEQYQNAMRNSDKQEARTESDRVLQKVIFSIMADNMELFKQYTDNQDFKKWLSDLVFNLTYNKNGKPYQPQK